jgi:hypothetical protein
VDGIADKGAAVALAPRKFLALGCLDVAVECAGKQIGIASGFFLKELDVKPVPHPDGTLNTDKPAKRVALVCRVELDEARHDAVKHLLAGGEEHLCVEGHPLISAIAP